jgi:hypothetical protein
MFSLLSLPLLSLVKKLRTAQRALIACFAIVTIAPLAGCSTTDEVAELKYRSHICFEATYSEMQAQVFSPVQAIKMQNTNAEFHVLAAPALTDWGFLSTLAVDVGYAEGMPPVPSLIVYLPPAAAQKFYNECIARKNYGCTRAFLFVNNIAVGILRISPDDIKKGALIFTSDLKSEGTEDLRRKTVALQKDINKSILVLRKKTAEDKKK